MKKKRKKNHDFKKKKEKKKKKKREKKTKKKETVKRLKGGEGVVDWLRQAVHGGREDLVSNLCFDQG